jgi:SNF2 family DNA or RNA helicase
MSSQKDEIQLQIKIDKRMELFHTLLTSAKFDFKQYQYDGVEWCLRNEICPNPLFDVRGGFIADEMGLGKTIMMIGLMFVHFLPRTLIVVPPILLKQWETEIYKVSGHKCLIYHGQNKKTITQEEFNSRPIILTTYNTIQNKKNTLVNSVVWNRIIFDEAHHLRNKKTKIHKACACINGRARWLVTGTPIQNRFNDFVNLCSMIRIDPSKVKTEWKNILERFMLRRTKEDVGILLPPIMKHQCNTEWKTSSEKQLAEEIHSFIPNQTNVSKEKARRFAEMYNCLYPIVAIQKARQVCILPKILKKDTTISSILSSSELYTDIEDYSSKMNTLINIIISRKDNGRGKIIFCHYREEIDTIVAKLIEGGLKKVIKYDGRNSGGSNLTQIGDYADALVIQIQSGNEGLNLQQNFSEIYFVSPNWNPSIEDQAIARCHRIGQKMNVDIFKFSMSEFDTNKKSNLEDTREISIETYMTKVQESKKDLVKKFLESKSII